MLTKRLATAIKTCAVGLMVLILAHYTCFAGNGKQKRGIAKGDYDAAFEFLSEFIEDQLKKSKVVGSSVVVVSDTEVLWSEGFGYADKENNIKATPRTLFDTASATKLFTATAVMQLVERETVDLDKPLSLYLPEFSVKSRFSTTSDDITVRHLLTHHSGIPGDYLKGLLSNNPEAFTKYRDRFLRIQEMIQNEYVCYPPDYIMGYSNLGFELLGCLIDRVSGMSYFDYLEKNVLDRIGMTDSTIELNTVVISGMSKGYEKGKEVPLLYERDIPAGSLTTNANELASFMMAYLDDTDSRLLSKAAKERMFAPQNDHVLRDIDFKQGLGWMISDLGFRNVGRVVFHFGGEWASNSVVVLLLDQKIGIAVMTNSAEGEGAISKIFPEIIRTVFETKTGIKTEEEKDKARTETSIPYDQLVKLEGYYIYEGLGVVKVEEHKGSLRATSGGKKYLMLPYDNSRFGLKLLLFKFIPVKLKFLESMEFGFTGIEGDMLSPVYMDGAPMMSWGIRVEKPLINDLWLERQGEYEVENADDDFPIVSHWELIIEDGFLLLNTKLYGSLPFSLVLMPVNDDYALWGGIGRRTGDTFIFEEKDGDTRIKYSGYIYRKIK